MPSKPVIENECERCTRTWYTDASAAATKSELNLELTLGTEVIKSEFKCLCDGCQKTVKALVDQIAKVMKKSAPVRGAKKKVGNEEKPTSPTQSVTQQPAAPTPPASSQKPVGDAERTTPSVSSAQVPSSARAAHHPTK